MTTVCIAGKNDIAINALEFVLAEHPDLKLVAAPNPEDTGNDGWMRSFQRFARINNVEVVNLESLYGEKNLIFYSLEYSKIIDIKKFTSTNIFNIHFSLLPKYKGMYTSAMPILNSEKFSGVTLHLIDAGIDTGPIVDQAEFDIGADETARDIYFKYLDSGLKMFQRNFINILSGNFKLTQQAASGSSYYSKNAIDYTRLDICFKKTAQQVHDQFRAFTFREYQLPRFGGWEIFRSEITSTRCYGRFGEVVTEEAEFFIVNTIDYAIKLYKDYYSKFWEICTIGDIEDLKKSVDFIPDLDLYCKNGWTGLIRACYNGHLSIVTELISRGCDINKPNFKGTTPLMYAFSFYEKSKDLSILNALLDAGAVVDAVDANGYRLKNYFVARGHPDLGKILGI